MCQYQKFSIAAIFCALLMITQSNMKVYSEPEQTDNSGLIDNVDKRINRQTFKINWAFKQGLLQEKQAAKLKGSLKNIANEAAAARKQAGGSLSQTQLIKLDNELKETFNNINTEISASRRTSVSSKDALGPDWVAGEDGAQNPKKLRQQMKTQEKRQLRQYDQAMQQVQELQQQEYEKEMMKELGEQRPEILQNKKDIQKIRKKTGVD